MIAFAALLASSLTAAAALYQSKVFSDQLSATVWPYLSFNATNGPSGFTLTLANDGAGPAIIAGAELLVDGKHGTSLVRELQDAVRQAEAGVRHGKISYVASSLGPGEVIRPGAEANVITMRGANVAARFAPLYNRVAIHVYYCSLLNRCWLVRLHTTERPQDVTGQSFPHTSIEPE